MKIEFIEIQNFKSFKHWDKLHFNELVDGLYFVSGENQVDPEMGANGAGKSALFEAICWCLYGKTSTNLKASNVVAWGEKDCQVMIRLTDFTVTRSQNPNFIKINNDPVTQEELEKKLGYLGFESFLYSTFISQFSSKFFDLSPADKMIVFSDIMAETLYPWELRSIQAKTKATQIEVIIKNIEIDLSRMKGSLDQLESNNYEEQAKEFEIQRNKDLKFAKADLKIAVENTKVTKAAIKDNLKEKIRLGIELKKKHKDDDFQDKIDKVEEKYGQLIFEVVEKWKKYKSKKEKHSEEAYRLMAENKTYRRQLADIIDIAGESICPTCKQKVDQKVLDKERKTIQNILNEIENEFNDNEKQIEICNNELAKLKAKQDELIATQKDAISELQEIKRYREKEHGEILVKLRILETTNEGLVNNLKTLEANITKCEVTIVAIDNKENPYVTLEIKRQKDIKILQQSIDELVAEYSLNKKDYDAYSYWVKGFREIRLLLLYDSLKEFEISINNNLSKFGMEGWNVNLDIDRENKSGTLRKGFTVLVQSPYNNGSVPFDCWSGGEGQRLRLAGTLGLMDLIQSKRQVDFGIEIFDESSAWLSDKGVSDLVQILFERAKEQEKQIFLIDHKGLGSYGSFTGEIKVIKDKNGSRIEIL